ncbi:MAG: hypothetical protein ACO1QB_06755 [Verrucomicrobiales bacterium]
MPDHRQRHLRHYEYDALGQVIEGKKAWVDGTPVAGQQFEYAFDDIGNRTETKAGGDASGNPASLRSAIYNANSLNQYTSRTTPDKMDVIGLATAGATVAVDSYTNLYRRGQYFHAELPLPDGDGMNIPITATLGTNSTTEYGLFYNPHNPEVFSHDADGNLTKDGRWDFQWDGENRLVSASKWNPVEPAQEILFQYDSKGRRIGKQVFNDGSTNAVKDWKYIYDGWNLAGQVDATNNLYLSFQWGTDLSETMQGAGGVGGLVSMQVHYGAEAGNYFYAYDGNGNVVGLVNASSGAMAAQYEYGPFGELIRMSGPLAAIKAKLAAQLGSELK